MIEFESKIKSDEHQQAQGSDPLLRIAEEMDKTIDKVLDGAEKKMDNTVNDAVKGKDGTATVSEDGTAASQVSDPKKAAIGWNNYDFVAGDEIIFEDLVENEQIGEFPSKWDLFNGYAQVAEIDGVKCISLADDGAITPLFNDSKPYLTDAFTIEYDVYVVYGPDYGTDFNPHSWVVSTYLPTGSKIKQDRGGERTFNFQHQVSAGKDARILNGAYLSYNWPLPGNTERRSGSTHLNGVATNACIMWPYPSTNGRIRFILTRPVSSTFPTQPSLITSGLGATRKKESSSSRTSASPRVPYRSMTASPPTVRS